MADLTLADALTMLGDHATLSPCPGTNYTPSILLAKIGHQLPHFLAAPVILTPNRLAYKGANGHAIGGWTIVWYPEEP
jgi:hypothetical protein